MRAVRPGFWRSLTCATDCGRVAFVVAPEVSVRPRKVAVLGTRYADLSIEEQVLGPLGVELVLGDGGSAEEILDVARDAEVVLAGSRPRFDAGVLEALRCRGIVRYGIGLDTIDLEAARARGIWVARVSDYGTEAVAFHAVTSAMALFRRLPEADRSLRGGGWGVAGVRPLHLPSVSTAGVVGYGRIGRQAATYLRGLGFTVCAHDEYADVPPDDGVAAVPLDKLLETSDVVLLHAPGDPSGRPLIGPAELARMRPGSVLVNTARGSLVDLPALIDGLAAGRPGFAALDVFPAEPVDASLFAAVAERVLLTPHMAWYTEESEADMRRKAADEAGRLLRGEPLREPVVEGRNATA
jgi:D-3-phosphoglycerate dehydrogenase / 2-oxoglutarate reductase